jgi:hypothetical protein
MMMATNVVKLPNLPVLLTTLPEGADLQCLFDAFARNIELSRLNVDPVYWVIDVRNAHNTYSSSVTAWCQIAQGLSGSPVIPGLRMAFVANPSMMAFFVQMKLVAYTSLEVATTHAVAEVAQPQTAMTA